MPRYPSAKNQQAGSHKSYLLLPRHPEQKGTRPGIPAGIEQHEKYQQILQHLEAWHQKAAEPLQKHMQLLPARHLAAQAERRLAIPMFWFGVLCLLPVAAVVTLPDYFLQGPYALQTGLVFGVIWLIALVEFLVQMVLRITSGEGLSSVWWRPRLLAVFVPPFRMALRPGCYPEMVWLPFWGWCKANPTLERKVRAKFLIPILMSGFLMLLVFGIESHFADAVPRHFMGLPLQNLLWVAEGLVWTAFTLEFVLCVSLAEDKGGYCSKNWMDLLIILLPVFSVFRTITLVKLLKVKHLAQTARLKGLKSKAKRAVLVADLLNRLYLKYHPEREAKRLQKKLVANLQEREQLEEQLMLAMERTVTHYEKKKQRRKGTA